MNTEHPPVPETGDRMSWKQRLAVGGIAVGATIVAKAEERFPHLNPFQAAVDFISHNLWQ